MTKQKSLQLKQTHVKKNKTAAPDRWTSQIPRKVSEVGLPQSLSSSEPRADRAGSEPLSERRGEPSLSDPASDPRADAATAGEPGRDPSSSSSEPDRRPLLLPVSDCSSESDCRCALLFLTGWSLPESSEAAAERRGLPASLPERFGPPASESLSEAMRFLGGALSSSEPEMLPFWVLRGDR